MDSGLRFILLIFLGCILYLAYRFKWAPEARTRISELAQYVLIALVLIIGFVGTLLFLDSRGVPDKISLKWVNIILTAVFVFGYAVKRYWKFRSRWTLWAELALLSIAHFVLLARLSWTEGGYAWLLVVVGLPEIAVIFFLLDLMYTKNGELASGGSQASEKDK